MNIVILDSKTLGEDLDLSPLSEFGTVVNYPTTSALEVVERVKNAEIIVVNKVKITKEVIDNAPNLKIICETATGYDNIDTKYCKEKGIAVTNTPAYSVHSVALVTVSMVCALATHLKEYSGFINSGEYQKSASANKLTPIYHELNGLTWGIIGFGNIGKAVGKVAEAFGCKLLVNKQTPIDGYECVDVDTLIEKSDIITIHCPLTDKTRNIIDEKRLEKAKKNAIIVNVARGGVWNENAVANAIIEGKIGGIGCDVFSTEPMPENHPFNKLLSYDNVILTPHMAWGAYEARKRCFDIVIDNIKAFLKGESKNRV